MNDRSSDITNYTELKFSREQGFFDKSRGIRILIGIIFALSLFALLHFREVRVEVLEFNSVAPGYVVSQIDFDFFDEEATIILKQDAIRDLGQIYKISDKDIRQRRTEFGASLTANQEWRKSAADSSLEEMYLGIDELEKVLHQIRFTDPRTMQKMHELHMPLTYYMVYTPADLKEPVTFPAQIWNSIKVLALHEETFHQGTADIIIGFLQNQGWVLEEDSKADQALKKTGPKGSCR